MSDREKIIEKIKKILNIAKDDAASDGEIQAAMASVSSLMARHHLSEEDLAHEPKTDYQRVDEAAKGHYRSFVGGKFYAWETYLAAFVSEFVGVPCYLSQQKMLARTHTGIVKHDWWYKKPWEGKSVVFYGVAEDAMIAAEIYDELRVLICTMAYARFGQVYSKDGGKYCEGFTWGLNTKLTEERDKTKKLAVQTSSTALLVIERRNDLVEYKKNVATKYLENDLGLKLGKGAGHWGASGGSRESWYQGAKDGQNADVNATRNKKLT